MSDLAEWGLGLLIAIGITAGIFAAAWAMNEFEAWRIRCFKDED